MLAGVLVSCFSFSVRSARIYLQIAGELLVLRVDGWLYGYM